MIRIKIDGTSPAFLEMMKRREEIRESNKKKYDIPKEIRDKIEAKVKHTVELNEGKIDGQAFRLGMYSMYFILNVD